MYIMWYGLGRFMIEGLRTDSLMLGTMRVSQIIAALSILGGAALFFVLRARHNSLPADLFEEPGDNGEAIEASEETADDKTDEEIFDDNAGDEMPNTETGQADNEISEETANEIVEESDGEGSTTDGISVDDQNQSDQINSQGDNDEN